MVNCGSHRPRRGARDNFDRFARRSVDFQWRAYRKSWIVVSSLDGREKYARNGRDVEWSVPTWEYWLKVDASGFQGKRQFLKAYQPGVFRSVTPHVAWMHGQTDPRLYAKVVGIKEACPGSG